MAKIPTSRLNTAPKEYNETDFDLLVEDLQSVIQLLNTTYPKDIIDEEDKKQWFLMRGN